MGHKFPRFANVICEWPLYGQKPLHRQNSVERSGVGPFYGDRPPDNEQQSSTCFLPLMIASPLDVFIGCFLATSNEIDWCEIDKKRRLGQNDIIASFHPRKYAIKESFLADGNRDAWPGKLPPEEEAVPSNEPHNVCPSDGEPQSKSELHQHPLSRRNFFSREAPPPTRPPIQTQNGSSSIRFPHRSRLRQGTEDLSALVFVKE